MKSDSLTTVSGTSSCLPGTYPYTITPSYTLPSLIYSKDVWVAYDEDDDAYWFQGVFTEELEALRYAVNNGLRVKKFRSGAIDAQWDDD